MLTIRRATVADCDLIQSLAQVVFPATYGELLSSAQLDYMMAWMYSRETLLGEISGDYAWFVAYYDDDPCGYLSVQREAEGLFHLQKIYVLPSFQGLGAGVFLFDKAVEYIRSVHPGPCRMELNVNRQNKALGFYERRGMYKAREGDFAIGNGYYMNDYIMALDLE